MINNLTNIIYKIAFMLCIFSIIISFIKKLNNLL